MICYKVVSRKNPKNSTKSKFYPSIVSNGYIDLNTLAQNICAECTLTEHDMKAVLNALQTHIITALQSGHSVRLRDLGSYHLRINSKKGGEATAEEVTTNDVVKVRVHFCKSSNLLAAFKRSNPALKFKLIEA